ncbi:MAG: hypothetical protein E6L05_02405 [Thaumarchaeota archaeon]|nr:MAG: hypothetical protein E6L05_02405 [Nitrososphaerota archaeon]
MKENNAGDYGKNKDKLTCGNCDSPNLEYLEIKPYIQKKVGVRGFFGLKAITYFAACRCLDCNQPAFYEMPYYKKTNQKSTTR